LIGLQITDFNHKEHKDHKGLAKVSPILDSPKNLLCGLCVLLNFVVNGSSLNYVGQARQRL